MNINIIFDEYNVRDAQKINDVHIKMVKGEKGDIGYPTDEQVAEAVDAWLVAHPEATTTVQDGAITVAKFAVDVIELLDDKANIDGYYEEMTVGSAEQLLSSVYLTDKAPYNFRPSGGANEIGDRETDSITGVSLPWNQLVQNGNFANVSVWIGGTYTISNNVATFSLPKWGFLKQTVHIFANHKYLMCGWVKTTTARNTVWLNLVVSGANNPKETTSTTEWQFLSKIYDSQTTADATYGIEDISDLGETIQAKNIMLIDLTAMFGSTIADYIYTLEQATAGSGIAKLKSWGFFTKDYYAYSEPTFKHVSGLTSHKMVGFNQWDEEWELRTVSGNQCVKSKNPIHVFPDTTYYFKAPAQASIDVVDKNGTYLSYISSKQNQTFKTPKDCEYIKFTMVSGYGTTYNHDICINFHYDGERDGEYEPYKVHSYALDDDVVLMGIPQLDSDNNLVYYGDTYSSDGNVNHRMSIVDLGTLDFTLATSGNNVFWANLNGARNDTGVGNIPNLICTNYIPTTAKYSSAWANVTADKIITLAYDVARVFIRDSAYSDATAFNTAMSGVYLVYELATTTTESADAYQNPQIVDNWGTEEYIGSEIPVGHSTKYPPDLKAKVEVAPNAPTSDGLYLMKRENGENAYIAYVSPLPSVSEDGTFVLKATKSGGTTTLSWVAES